MKRAALLCLALGLAGCARQEALPVYGRVPAFKLTSQSGAAFDSRTLDGKVWVADFFFTSCPGPCPRMASQMHDVQERTRDLADVRMVSFSVDPQTDTPTVLAFYSKRNHADNARWHFLTGPQAELHQLSRNVFKLGDVDGSLMHSTRFVLVDRKGRIRGYYSTEDGDNGVPRLIEDIRDLARERG